MDSREFGLEPQKEETKSDQLFQNRSGYNNVGENAMSFDDSAPIGGSNECHTRLLAYGGSAGLIRLQTIRQRFGADL